MDLLEQRFHSEGKRVGSVFVLPLDTAINAIQFAKSESISILGLDGFRLKGDSIQPLMEHSIDLSGELKTHEKALEFVRSRKGKELVFEVVLDE